MLDQTRLPAAPRAQRRPKVSTRHGITLTDDYAWLRADNHALGGAPLALIREPAGLVRTVDYLDAARARI